MQRKPGALRNGAPFTELPDSFKQLQSKLLRRIGGDREMADFLALVLFHDEQQVEQAVHLALTAGQVSKQHVLNCLGRLQDNQPPQPVAPPNVLKLINESRANTARYDHLRRVGHEQ